MTGIEEKARENRRKWRWRGLGFKLCQQMCFPGGSDCKESACDVGDLGSIPGMGRSPGDRNGYPLQYSRLEDPHGQRTLEGSSPWGCKESDTAEQLSLYASR